VLRTEEDVVAAQLPPLPPADRAWWRRRVDELVDRTGLSARALTACAVVAALLIGGAVVFTARPQAATPAAVASTPAPPVETEEPATTTTASALVVDVVGAVVRPGLLRVPPGSRVADAIAAAGGPTPDADLVQVNQARALADGEQVRVPRRGEVLPTTAAPKPGAGKAARTVPAQPLDLNSATADELDALPGVGPATASAIVEWRTKNRRFRSVEDLLEVPGIGEAKLERLRPYVRV
jgi:competence protein ComEA